ncbi:MAG: methyltransferase domain-containing protein [Ramlibacter sp.]
MHPTALDNGSLFFECYLATRPGATVIEIGSQDVNGSLRPLAPPGCRYTGLDFAAGPGVDQVLDDPYRLPLEAGSVDAVVSSSCFEHIEFFWLMFNEVLRVLKPDGLFYLNAPSNGEFHRYPVDCWRFYPDAGTALVNWARRSGYKPVLLESFTTPQRLDIWNDFVSVYLKDESCLGAHPQRMLDRLTHFSNGRRHGADGLLNPQRETEDLATLRQLRGSAKPLA